jgi:peroxiredoxin
LTRYDRWYPETESASCREGADATARHWDDLTLAPVLGIFPDAVASNEDFADDRLPETYPFGL